MQTKLPFASEPEPEPAQTLLASMLQRAQLYSTSQTYAELLEFVARMPHIAPFNAMILNIQKPGLRFAATESDWQERFRRSVREGARPLVILRPFCPVVFVYDVEDTLGDPLPALVERAFRAQGSITAATMTGFEYRLWKFGIYVKFIEYGDGHAGHIAAETMTVEEQSTDRKKRPSYRLRINAKHEPNVQFTTLAHELAHLYLGHLGSDSFLKIPDRQYLDHAGRELEAESVAYLVCHRANVQFDPESYLAKYVREGNPTDQIDVYAIMRAAGQVEAALGVSERSRIE